MRGVLVFSHFLELEDRIERPTTVLTFQQDRYGAPREAAEQVRIDRRPSP